MSIYACSDIHGCYNEFKKMLELINFRDNDELYICGDILDRGENSIDVYDYIRDKSNIYLIKGNHEKMFEEYFEEGNCSLWYRNGGSKTFEQMLRQLNYDIKSIYEYIKELPFIKVVDKFILVHGGVYFPKNYNELTLEEFIELQEEDTCLWDRSNIDYDLKFKDYTVVCGHTPVQTITYDYENVKILHKEGHIYIDCGCVFKHRNGKLACLRLDDMEEFYVS